MAVQRTSGSADSLPDDQPKRPRGKRLLAGLAVVAIIVFALIGCGPSEKEFRAADPYGHRACEAFGQGEGAGGDIHRGYMRRAAADGAQAATPRIREAVRVNSQSAPVIARLSDFRRACKKSGYNF